MVKWWDKEVWMKSGCEAGDQGLAASGWEALFPYSTPHIRLRTASPQCWRVKSGCGGKSVLPLVS